MRMRSVWLPLLACTLALAAVCPGQAPAQEGQDPALDRLDDLMFAFQNNDAEAFIACLQPDLREDFLDEAGDALVDVIQVYDWQVTGEDRSEGVAHFEVAWDASIDPAALRDRMFVRLVTRYLGSADADLDELRDRVADFESHGIEVASEMAEFLSQGGLDIRVAQFEDGEWYVNDMDPTRRDGPVVGLASGASSPQAAVERVLEAMQSSDVEAFMLMVPPDGHAEMEAMHIEALLLSLTVESAELVDDGEVGPGGGVSWTVEWETTFDTDAFRMWAVKLLAHRLSQEGMDPAAIEAMIDEVEAELEMLGNTFEETLASGHMRFDTGEENGRWYLINVDRADGMSIEPHMPDEARVRETVITALEAMLAGDVDTLMEVTTNQDESMLAAMCAALEIGEWSIDSIDMLPGGDAEVLVSWDVELDMAVFQASMLEAAEQQLIDAGLEGEMLKQQLEMIAQQIAIVAPQVRRQLEAPRLRLPVLRSGDSFRIDRPEPVFGDEPVDPDPPGEGGAESPEACAERMLEAFADSDVDAALPLIPPSEREEAQFFLRAFLDGITVEDWEILSVEVDGSNATVEYEWNASVDSEAIADGMVAAWQDMARKQGLAEAQIREMAPMIRASMGQMTASLEASMADGETQVMTLESDGNRWYVSEPFQVG